MARESTSDMPKSENALDNQESIKGVQVVSKKGQSIVDTEVFAITMCCIVFCNIIFIGLETEYGHTSELFGAVNNGFLLAYIVELMMRMLTHGLAAMKDVYVVLDIVLITLSFAEKIIAANGMARSLPAFRLMRVSRLVRQSKTFRESKELRAIAMSSQRMVRTLVWVLVFFFLILWIMATVAHMAIGKSARWNGTLDPDQEWEPFEALDINEYFGTVFKSYMTLLQVVTLSNWSPHVARPIIRVYPVTFVFFVLFLFITTYGLMVSIVSNLVQDSMTASKVNAMCILERKREERKKVGVQARDILSEVDADGSGALDVEEIQYALEVSDLEEILRNLGVPVTDAESIVRLLDYTGSGTVSYEELVDGIVKMDEDITKRDYAMMGFWVKNLLERTKFLEERLEILCQEISFIRKRLGGSFQALNHMIRNAKDTQMRQIAIHTLRTSGPPLPPVLEKVVVKKQGLAMRSDKEELVAFAGRLLGGPPRGKRAGSPDVHQEPPARITLFNNTMQPAPPRMAVAQRRAARNERAWADKYEVDRSVIGLADPQSENMKSLKAKIKIERGI